MVPIYMAEDDLALHYWDRIGQHYIFCKDSHREECYYCVKNCVFSCGRIELGTMTRYAWQIKKLTPAEQAEVLLLHPEIGVYCEDWDPDDEQIGVVHEEEDEWPEPPVCLG